MLGVFLLLFYSFFTVFVVACFIFCIMIEVFDCVGIVEELLVIRLLGGGGVIVFIVVFCCIVIKIVSYRI